MQKVPSSNDRSAKNGTIASHRWLGASTAVPLFYGQTTQAELTEKFLQDKVLSVDIFTLKSEAQGARLAALDQNTENGMHGPAKK